MYLRYSLFLSYNDCWPETQTEGAHVTAAVVKTCGHGSFNKRNNTQHQLQSGSETMDCEVHEDGPRKLRQQEVTVYKLSLTDKTWSHMKAIL
jgi:hypothetical protein